MPNPVSPPNKSSNSWGGLVYPQHNYTVEYPHDLNVRKEFLRTQRGLPINERINTFDYIKIQNFCSRYHKENAKASHGIGQRQLTKALYL